MSSQSPANTGRSIGAFGAGIAFPALTILSVGLIILPLPAVVMDLLLACNITLSVVILLTTMSVKRPLDFSVFPTVLLGSTLFRLVLNIASSRLILTRGAIDGTAAAGEVIEAFGDFVAGGQIVVGVILFAILVIVQFVVITKGATRISEVAARFALDGMPGKQMAIDADLGAGQITQDQARARRAEVHQQADFYGAMDGAGKFVRGDAIAGIIITLINIVGGLYVGMVMHGMTISRAAEVFTKLTIGDGLVSQVPAFLISLAAGLLTTRSSSDSDLSRDVVGQLFGRSDAMAMAAVFVAGLAFTGLPMVPMIALSIICAITSFLLGRKTKAEAQEKHAEQIREAAAPPPPPKPEDQLSIDPLELELGYGLIRLADPASGGDLLDRVTRVRQKIAQELGLVMPKVRVRDNIRLEERAYQIKLKDVPIARGEVYPDGFLAIETPMTSGAVPGIETVEPAFGRPARWIEAGQRERAEILGFSVVEPSTVIVTHLTEMVRSHSDELFSRQQVHQLLDQLKQHAPKLVEEVIPDVIKPAQLHMVLNHLLRERVPIRDLETILETLGAYGDRTKDFTLLTEYVRHALSRTICQQYRDADNTLHVIEMDPELEDALSAGFDYTERGLIIKLSPQLQELVAQQIEQTIQGLLNAGQPPVILTSPTVRAGLKQMTWSSLPNLAVLSLNEVTRDTRVRPYGRVTAPNIRPAMAAKR